MAEKITCSTCQKVFMMNIPPGTVDYSVDCPYCSSSIYGTLQQAVIKEEKIPVGNAVAFMPEIKKESAFSDNLENRKESEMDFNPIFNLNTSSDSGNTNYIPANQQWQTGPVSQRPPEIPGYYPQKPYSGVTTDGHIIIKGKTQEQLKLESWNLPSPRELFMLFIADIVLGVIAIIMWIIPLVILTFALGFILPSLIWISYVSRVDTIEPEPKWAVKGALYSGMVSVIPVLFFSVILMGIIGAIFGDYEDEINLNGPSAFSSIAVLIALLLNISIAPVVEEWYKPKGAFRKIWREIDSELDGIIYGVTAGMGFAMVENFMYQLSAVGDSVQWTLLVLMRGLTSTLIHALCSGIMGYGFAKVLLANKKTPGMKPPVNAPIEFFLIAVFFHWVWNGVLTMSSIYSDEYSWVVYGTVLFMLFWPVFCYKTLNNYLRKGQQADREHWEAYGIK